MHRFRIIQLIPIHAVTSVEPEKKVLSKSVTSLPAYVVQKLSGFRDWINGSECILENSELYHIDQSKASFSRLAHWSLQKRRVYTKMSFLVNPGGQKMGEIISCSCMEKQFMDILATFGQKERRGNLGWQDLFQRWKLWCQASGSTRDSLTRFRKALISDNTSNRVWKRSNFLAHMMIPSFPFLHNSKSSDWSLVSQIVFKINFMDRT